MLTKPYLFRDICSSRGIHYAAAMSGGTDVLEILLAYGSEIDAINQDGATALFFACQCNNQFAASVLIDQGANVRIKNLQGMLCDLYLFKVTADIPLCISHMYRVRGLSLVLSIRGDLCFCF